MLHDSVDRAVVACLSGSAIIDAEQILSAGQEIELWPGAGTGPRRLPDALALNVAPPVRVHSEVRREVQRITVSGRTNPGAHVFVNGERARVDDAGEFAHTVELAEGERRIEVEARDVIGRERKMTVAVIQPATPRRRPPQAPIETEWQWEDPPGEGPG